VQVVVQVPGIPGVVLEQYWFSGHAPHVTLCPQLFSFVPQLLVPQVAVCDSGVQHFAGGGLTVHTLQVVVVHA
jgi:hypothetical protein